MVIIACAPGHGMMQSRAISEEAWPRRGGSNLSILQTSILKAKGTIAESSCDVKRNCSKILCCFRENRHPAFKIIVLNNRCSCSPERGCSKSRNAKPGFKVNQSSTANQRVSYIVFILLFFKRIRRTWCASIKFNSHRNPAVPWARIKTNVIGYKRSVDAMENDSKTIHVSSECLERKQTKFHTKSICTQDLEKGHSTYLHTWWHSGYL